jgi:hypothetical protein
MPANRCTRLRRRSRRSFDRSAPRGSKRTAPGKWTLAEILVHLAQTEIIVRAGSATRWRPTATLVQPFDQDWFMAVEPAVDGDAALARMSAFAGSRYP